MSPSIYAESPMHQPSGTLAVYFGGTAWVSRIDEPTICKPVSRLLEEPTGPRCRGNTVNMKRFITMMVYNDLV